MATLRRVRRVAALTGLVGGLCAGASAQTPDPGTLDASFGEGGIVRTPLQGEPDWANDVAVDAEGRIVVCGVAFIGAKRHFLVMRHLPDGQPDPGFGPNGVVITDVGSSSSDGGAQAMAIQPDGRIVVAGWRQTYSSLQHDVVLVRYHADGSVDANFGGTGQVLTNLGRDAATLALALQADGKILVAGHVASSGTGRDLFVIRYHPTGARDVDFGANGLVAPTIVGDQQAHGIALTNTSRILLAGWDKNAGPRTFLLARLRSTGELDDTFSSGGLVTTTFGAGDASALAIAVQPDGKIVLAGEAIMGGYSDVAVARYTSTGTLDTGFDGDGKRTVAASTAGDRAADVVVQSDGKVVVAGWAGLEGLLMRFRVDGTSDTGAVLTPFGASGGYGAVALQADGKIVTAGSARQPDNVYDEVVVVARYHGDIVDLIFTDGFDAPLSRR